MKKQNILISLLAVMALTGCTSPSSQESKKDSEPGKSSEPIITSEKEEKPATHILIDGFKTVKFEAEEFDTENWEEDGYYDNVIVEDNKASGKKYLAGAEPDSDSYINFEFEVTKFSKVVLSAAYAQNEDWLSTPFEMNKTYSYNVEAVSPFLMAEGKDVLPERDSASKWDLMEYVSQDLYPGTYKVTLSVMPDTPKGCPSIDYIQFKTTDASKADIDPSTITEADIPDNDMRNLQQYKYLMDEDVYKYKTYATGADLSAPRGMKLRFDDVATASKYYVQVAESEAGLASAPVNETNEKVYTFHNAKLDTKYYYRAATSESDLANAAVKNITSTDVAPRVVMVPNVLNFRDIGGWESELVPGAKINQGMYFRCAQLDAGRGGNTTSKLDTAGKGKAAIKELGIKVDIDMRDSYNFPSGNISAANSADWPVAFVGAAVPSGSEPVRWEGGTYQNTNIANQYKIIFDTLAKCDTDPVMLHCTYGADRTGIVTFFLESLLGMSQENMTRDYLWTQFTQGRNVKIEESEGAEFPQWIKKTEACEGDTFADKMENHLMEFGIAKSTLEHIREIFIPGYVAKA